MATSAEVLRLKIRQYFGPVRKDRKRLLRLLALPGFGILWGLPIGWGLARQDGAGFFPFGAETIQALLSVVLAFAVLQGLGGGVFAHPSEIEFVLTTPIRPRQFLLADYAFQFLVFQVFLLPLVLGVSLGVGIGTGNFLRSLAVLIVAEGFLLLPGLIGQSLGVVSLTGHRWTARGIVTAATLVLLLPALHFVTPFPLRYADFPTPAHFVTSLVLGLIRGSPVELSALLGFLGSLAGMALVWSVLSGREFFPGLRPLMLVSFGQPMDFSQIMRLAAERRGRRTHLGVDVFREPRWRALTKLQVVRWARSGLLIAGIATVVLFGFMGLILGSVPSGGPPNPSPLIFAVVPILAPSLLALPTVSGERDRLWPFAVIPDGMSRFFEILFLSLVTVAIPLAAAPPLLVMVVTQSFSPLAVVGFVGASVGSSWAAVWFLSRFEVRLGGPSLPQFLFVGVCGLSAALFAAPAIVSDILLRGNFLLAAGSAALYAIVLFAIGRLLYRRIGRTARSFVP